MSKKDLKEQEIRTRYITPAIREAGWALDQIREEVYLTDGQLYPRGQKAMRGERKFADYVLYRESVPLAVVEAKDNNHPLGGGMQQALDYADMLDAPFAYSSTGDGFLQHALLALAERSKHSTCKLQTDKLLDFTIRLPSMEIQSKILTKLESLLSLCDALAAQVAGAEETRQRLL